MELVCQDRDWDDLYMVKAWKCMCERRGVRSVQGCALLGWISKRGLAFMPSSPGRKHGATAKNCWILMIYSIMCWRGSIVSLSPGSKKRINWTENGGAGKLTVIRRDVNGWLHAHGWISPRTVRFNRNTARWPVWQLGKLQLIIVTTAMIIIKVIIIEQMGCGWL